MSISAHTSVIPAFTMTSSNMFPQPSKVLVFHGFVQAYHRISQKVKFQIFFESHNGFGVFDEPWDAILGFGPMYKKLFSYILVSVFAYRDPWCSLCYILIRKTSV